MSEFETENSTKAIYDDPIITKDPTTSFSQGRTRHLTRKIAHLGRRLEQFRIKIASLKTELEGITVLYDLGVFNADTRRKRELVLRAFLREQESGIEFEKVLIELFDHFNLEMIYPPDIEAGLWLKRWWLREKSAKTQGEFNSDVAKIKQAIKATVAGKSTTGLDQKQSAIVNKLVDAIDTGGECNIQFGNFVISKSSAAKNRSDIQVQDLSSDQIISLQQDFQILRDGTTIFEN